MKLLFYRLVMVSVSIRYSCLHPVPTGGGNALLHAGELWLEAGRWVCPAGMDGCRRSHRQESSLEAIKYGRVGRRQQREKLD